VSRSPFFDFRNPSRTDGQTLEIFDGKYQFTLLRKNVNSSNLQAVWTFDIPTSSNTSLHSWTHLAGTFDSWAPSLNQTFRFYVNGTARSPARFDSSGSFIPRKYVYQVIQSYVGGWSRINRPRIDDFIIFDRVLSPLEITQTMSFKSVGKVRNRLQCADFDL
jgi:hypothetical protein